MRRSRSHRAPSRGGLGTPGRRVSLRVSTLQRISRSEGGRERERRKERKTWGPKFWWSKCILLAEMQTYISLVRYLVSYYTGWNFINSHNMDSLIHTRSLTLKRVTEEVIERNPSRYPFPWSQELRAALLVPGTGTDKEQRVLEKRHTKEKMQHIGFLKVKCPVTYYELYQRNIKDLKRSNEQQ